MLVYTTGRIRALITLTCAAVTLVEPLGGNDSGPYDVVIYGGTSAGIAAAVQVKRMGRSVAVIEPTHRIGGLTTGGLGSTDIGNKKAIGGIAREFYRRVHRHYQLPKNWKWQTSQAYEKMSRTAQTRTEKPCGISSLPQRWRS